MKHNNVKVTTTSGFGEVKIDQYAEPITAHLVIGMNFFKDFLSGFTDFFGGKSKSYQNTLESINKEVIDQLRQKAHNMGANCIVGLKIDNDEISAQGKSMLMVTAIGTPAKAKFPDDDLKGRAAENEIITQSLFNVLEQKVRYIEAGKKGDLKFDNSFWDFAKKYRVAELSDYIIFNYEKEGNRGFPIEELHKDMIEFFLELESSESKAKLYPYLQSSDSSISLKKNIVNLIKKAGLLDFELVIPLLDSSDFEVRKLSLSLLSHRKSSYSKGDIGVITKIKDSLREKFPRLGSESTKKSPLSSRERDIWVCQCERENEKNNLHCSKCGSDIFGFKSGEINPPQIIEKLEFDLGILNDTL